MSTALEILGLVERILLRSWIFGFILMLISLAAMVIGGEQIYASQNRIFGVSEHDAQLVFYWWLALLKLAVLIVFFIPWLATKLVLRSAKR